ncbi:energy transducer TonB [Zhongshania sp.]|uniref:energy transducer TonB n=1 Tax=Zhongshania sp. TaxID=1971902 RepID=UPI0035648C65
MRQLPWIIAFVFAVGVHASLLYLAEQSPRPTPLIGADGEGRDGLEIGLGMSGSYADVAKHIAQSEVVPEPSPAPKPKHKPAPKLKPKPAPAKPPTKPQGKPAEKAAQLPEKVATSISAPTAQVKAEAAVDGYQSAADASASRQAKAETAKPDATTHQNTRPDTAAKAMVRGSGSGEQRRAGGKTGDSQHYFSQVMAQLNQYKRYPTELKKRKTQGVVTLKFGIRRNGEIFAASIKTSSGHGDLDDAALQMLADASPLPPLPASIKKEEIHLVIPIEYALITNDFHED